MRTYQPGRILILLPGEALRACLRIVWSLVVTPFQGLNVGCQNTQGVASLALG